LAIYSFKSLVIMILLYSHSSFAIEAYRYKDVDNDQIIVLDKKIQQELKTIPEIRVSTIYDDPKQMTQFNKYINNDIIEKDNHYNYYTVVDGDTLDLIALKIYQDKNLSEELLELNEESIFKFGLKKCLKLKYVNKK
jgi:hypothetical protein